MPSGPMGKCGNKEAQPKRFGSRRKSPGIVALFQVFSTLSQAPWHREMLLNFPIGPLMVEVTQSLGVTGLTGERHSQQLHRQIRS